MLSRRCRRFRMRFEPGRRDRHRRHCPECAGFAATVEAAARAGARLPLPKDLLERLEAIARSEPLPAVPEPVPSLPLPASLAQRLRAIARSEPETAGSPAAPPVTGPVPSLPLPGALRGRLRAIPRSPQAAPPPVWIRQAWYSVAASLLLAAFAGTAMGNPVERARPAVAEVERWASAAWRQTEANGRSWWEVLSDSTARRLDQGRESLEALQGFLTELPSQVQERITALQGAAETASGTPEPTQDENP